MVPRDLNIGVSPRFGGLMKRAESTTLKQVTSKESGRFCWYQDALSEESSLVQGGPLPVISGVISPINGLING